MKRFFSKIWGYILFGIAKFLDVVLGGIIKGISFLVNITQRVRKLIAPSFGCIIALLIFNPYSFIFLMRTWLWIPLLIIFIFPLLGSTFVSFLAYWKYVLCEYLYDKSDDCIKGTSKGQIFGEYGDRYKRQKAAEAEAERKRRYAEEEAARERRRQQQQEQWRRIFEEFFGGFAGGAGTYGPFGGAGTGGYGQGYNPAADFNQQYRQSCDALEIPYDTDEYQVKLAYRKKAKQYHPDINKSADATQKFQEISSAYEFLSQENIDRYKRLNNL